MFCMICPLFFLQPLLIQIFYGACSFSYYVPPTTTTISVVLLLSLFFPFPMIPSLVREYVIVYHGAQFSSFPRRGFFTPPIHFTLYLSLSSSTRLTYLIQQLKKKLK